MYGIRSTHAALVAALAAAVTLTAARRDFVSTTRSTRCSIQRCNGYPVPDERS